MSLGFDLSISSQSTAFFFNLDVKICEKLHEVSQSHPHTLRFTGLPIAFCFALIDLVTKVTRVFELFLKGFVNILGSPFFKNCQFFTGVMQMCKLPSVLIIDTIAWPLKSVVMIPLTTIRMAISPVSYSHEQLEFAKDFEHAYKTQKKNVDSNKVPEDIADVVAIVYV